MTNAQDNPALPAEVIAFLIQEIQDRHLAEVTRNNIANALLYQDAYPAALNGMLRRTIDDENEGITWRVYAVQHLATAYARTGTHADHERLLAATMHANPSIASTAIIQLDRLDSERVRPADAQFDLRLAERGLRLDDDPVVVGTAILVIGRRGKPGSASIVRAALQSPDPHVRRVAIGALGLLGGPDDLPALERAMQGDDRLITMAARAAAVRISAR